MRDQVKQWTGIPISVGLGSTKTLAKAANRLAKKQGIGCELRQKMTAKPLKILRLRMSGESVEGSVLVCVESDC